MAIHIMILGAGITGLTSALALSDNLLDTVAKITIFEIRSTPATIGGAVNLTPKALRYLDHLGVHDVILQNGFGARCTTIELFDLYSGSKYAELDFRGAIGKGIGTPGKEHFSRRVMRSQLQWSLLNLLSEQNDTEIIYGKKVVEIVESPQEVTLKFEDGETVSGDVLLGCDGIHSAVRSLLIDPERKPTYTGSSVVMATSTVRPEATTPWKSTGLVSSRQGTLMCTYYSPNSPKQFVGAVMEIASVGSREGWHVRGSDQDAIKQDLLQKFASDKFPQNQALIEDAGEWNVYPVYMLPEGGRWISPKGRCILLGDAAHAVSIVIQSAVSCATDTH